MNQPQITGKIRNCIALTICLLVNATVVTAKEWFFRPSDNGPYGSASGVSYSDAWHRTSQFVWGPGGIQPGDTLFICGSHDAGPGDQQITPKISGTADRRITISGACPMFPGAVNRNDFDPGSIFAANIRITDGWNEAGSGVYSRTESACVDTQVTEDKATPLQPIPSKSDNPNLASLPYHEWPAGSYFQPLNACGGSGILYYKPTSGSPFSHTVHTSYGQAIINLRGVDHIVVRDLDLAHSKTLDGLVRIENSRFIEILENTIRWAGGIAISIVQGSGNGIISGNTIHDAANGIYANSGNLSENNADGWVISNNEIFDIDQYCYYCHADSHAIAFQGGSNNVVENNHLHHIGGSGVTFYTFSLQRQENNTVRFNYVHDVADLGNCSREASTKIRPCRNERGIEHSSSNRDDPETSGKNIVHHNVLAHIGGVALRSKGLSTPTGPAWRFINNTVVDARVALSWLEFSRPENDLSDGIIRNPGLEARNNIFVNSREFHVRQGAVDVLKNHDGIILSNNLYYPDRTITGNRFQWLKQTFSDFSSWANASGQGQGSITEDPRFVSVSANDFRLTTSSPALQAGQRVSLTSAALGFSPGPGPDMGALGAVSAFSFAPVASTPTTSTSTSSLETTTTTTTQTNPTSTSTTTLPVATSTSTTTRPVTTTTQPATAATDSPTTSTTDPEPAAIAIPATATIATGLPENPQAGIATPANNEISASSSGAIADTVASSSSSSGGGGGGGCTVRQNPSSMTAGPWLWLILGAGLRIMTRRNHKAPY